MENELLTAESNYVKRTNEKLRRVLRKGKKKREKRGMKVKKLAKRKVLVAMFFSFPPVYFMKCKPKDQLVSPMKFFLIKLILIFRKYCLQNKINKNENSVFSYFSIPCKFLFKYFFLS